MYKKESIMLCLENLNIGGVETAVINQAIFLKKKGWNVVVLAQKGIYTSFLENNGIDFLEFNFENKNYFENRKINKLVEIIKEYNVKEVHINQFTLLTDLIPACFLTNTPYITYLHMTTGIINDESLNAYNWFEKTFPIYNELFKLTFKYSSKIIAITPTIADYTANRYNIDKEKMIIVPHSLNLDEYKCSTEVSSIKNILIISRLKEEKIKSIFSGIDLFIELNETLTNDLHLNIVGDGPDKNVVKDYISNKNIMKDVTFFGAVTNVKDIIENSDIVIGVDRCILEAISMKRIAVISGYNGNIKGIVKAENIDTAKNENFCGYNLPDMKIEDVVKELSEMNKNKLSEMLSYNYDFVKKNLDISNNSFIGNENSVDYSKNFFDIISRFIVLNNELGNLYTESSYRLEKNWKDHLEYQKWSDTRFTNLEEQYNSKCEELANICNSKIYKIVKKIIKE